MTKSTTLKYQQYLFSSQFPSRFSYKFRHFSVIAAFHRLLFRIPIGKVKTKQCGACAIPHIDFQDYTFHLQCHSFNRNCLSVCQTLPPRIDSVPVRTEETYVGCPEIVPRVIINKYDRSFGAKLEFELRTISLFSGSIRTNYREIGRH